MNGVEAVELIGSWRRLLIEGNAERIAPMLADIDAHIRDKGFARDSERENHFNRDPHQRNRMRCFVGGPKGGPRLMLCLNIVSERRIRGGTYSLLEGSPNTDSVAVAAVIEDVIKNVIVPAANRNHLRVTRPRWGPISIVPPKTMAALVAFCDVATGGGLPLSEPSETLWRRFLVTASRDDVAFDQEELRDWFVSNGWTSEEARGLVERFLRETSLLAEYSETSGN